MKRCATTAGLVLLELWLGAVGCAAPPRAEPAPPAEGPVEAVAADQLFPLEARQGAFRVVEGADRGKTVPATLEQAGEGWVLTLEGRQRTFIERNDAGDLIITREDDFGENVTVRYDPAVVMLPAQVTADAVREGEVTMTVYGLGTDEKREQGTCRYHVSVRGQEDVTTPAGAYEGTYLIHSTRQIDLNLADVTVRLDTAYAAGVGQVAETVVQETKALGLIGGTKTTRLERAE